MIRLASIIGNAATVALLFAVACFGGTVLQVATEIIASLGG